jgi:hypothetical protein
MCNWFTAKKEALNLDKRNIIKFVTTIRIQYWLQWKIDRRADKYQIPMFANGYSHSNWKKHINQMIPKLSAPCYAVRLTFHTSNINTLKLIYFVHFKSIMKYKIILGGKFSNSKRIFTLQKKIIRIMADTNPRSTCRCLFKKTRGITSSM